MRHEEQEFLSEGSFWRTYFATTAIVLAIGLLPSIMIVSKQGIRVIFPERLREESVSDVLAQDWIIHPRCVTMMTGRERGEILLQLDCSELKDNLVAYYEEQFEKQGYVQKIAHDRETTTITAKKDQVQCQVKISGFSVQIILSKTKS
ncbi:MAG: hypothetical protein NZ585_03205 [Chloracidobacterium sp.]|nr:hypothetical protein [Chloracidobacterium sp.]MDW8217246.1 hypothetical protein [Acidobacteriota bacterium]